MTLGNPYSLLMLVSGLVFLATAGFLIANLGKVAGLFGRARRDAEPGDLIADRRSAGRGASAGAVKAMLALHVAALAGIVVGALALTGVVMQDHPAADDGLPAEMMPVPGAG